MKNELDLTKILKVGDKVYSTVGGDGVVEYIQSDLYPIGVKFNKILLFHGKDGKFSPELDGECVLFPSKNQRDWSKFERPAEFKPGQMVLVRDREDQEWCIRFFVKENKKSSCPFYTTHYPRNTTGSSWRYCKAFDIEEYLKQQGEQ